MSAQYPFLFQVLDPEKRASHYVVIIAEPYEYKSYDSAWMDDPSLPPTRTFVPDVDLEKTQHRFKTEREALRFIKDWWTKYDVG